MSRQSMSVRLPLGWPKATKVFYIRGKPVELERAAPQPGGRMITPEMA